MKNSRSIFFRSISLLGYLTLTCLLNQCGSNIAGERDVDTVVAQSAVSNVVQDKATSPDGKPEVKDPNAVPAGPIDPGIHIPTKPSSGDDSPLLHPELPPRDTEIVCGNGELEPGEVCDDGNQEDGDGCPSTCIKTPVCGDKVLDLGESCDDGNLVNGDGCESDCNFRVVCGDGKQDFGEECDDGNSLSGDGCEQCLVVKS